MINKTLTAMTVGLCLTATANAVEVDSFHYSVTENLPGSWSGSTHTPDPATADNWQGDDAGDWVGYQHTLSGWDETRYLRNNSGGESTITRPNDSNFSYEVLPGLMALSFESQVLVNNNTQSNGNMWLGLASGGDLTFGIHVNDFRSIFIVDNTGAVSTGAKLAYGNTYRQIRLDVDFTGTTPLGSVYVNDTAVASDIELDYDMTELTNLDGLYVTTKSPFTGPASYNITTTIPEPASMALLGLGGTLMLLGRRRRTTA